MTVWYVPDDDVSRIRVPWMRARGDEGKESPYAKRRTVHSMGNPRRCANRRICLR